MRPDADLNTVVRRLRRAFEPDARGRKIVSGADVVSWLVSKCYVADEGEAADLAEQMRMAFVFNAYSSDTPPPFRNDPAAQYYFLREELYSPPNGMDSRAGTLSTGDISPMSPRAGVRGGHNCSSTGELPKSILSPRSSRSALSPRSSRNGLMSPRGARNSVRFEDALSTAKSP